MMMQVRANRFRLLFPNSQRFSPSFVRPLVSRPLINGTQILRTTTPGVRQFTSGQDPTKPKPLDLVNELFGSKELIEDEDEVEERFQDEDNEQEDTNLEGLETDEVPDKEITADEREQIQSELGYAVPEVPTYPSVYLRRRDDEIAQRRFLEQEDERELADEEERKEAQALEYLFEKYLTERVMNNEELKKIVDELYQSISSESQIKEAPKNYVELANEEEKAELALKEQRRINEEKKQLFDKVKEASLLRDDPKIKTKEEFYEKIFDESISSEEKLSILNKMDELNQSKGTRNSIQNLRFFHYYPSEIKKWIMWARLNRGFFYKDGTWRDLGYVDEFYEATRQQEIAMLLQKSTTDTLPPVDAELVGKYKYGVKEEDLRGFPNKIKRVLGFYDSTWSDRKAYRNTVFIEKFGREPGDSGSSEVQICALTQRIRHLQEHLRKNKKDKANRRSLQILIERRRAQINYLRPRRPVNLFKVLKELGLKDMA